MIQFMNRGVDMTLFMKGPLGPSWNTYDDPTFMNRGADMTPFMKGPLGPPSEHIRQDPNPGLVPMPAFRVGLGLGRGTSGEMTLERTDVRRCSLALGGLFQKKPGGSGCSRREGAGNRTIFLFKAIRTNVQYVPSCPLAFEVGTGWEMDAVLS